MSWNDFHRRQRAIQAVLEHAREHPGETLTPQAVAEARGVFSDTDELLGALQYKWTQALTGRVELAFCSGDGTADGDRVDAVATAWHRTAVDHPVLRDVLDRHCPSEWATYREAAEREERLLAMWSGLAEHSADAAMLRAGSALRRLLQVPLHTAASRSDDHVPLAR